MQKTAWRIGCSGFYYKEWKGIFYPDKLATKNWFSFYTQHFNTLEINNTFYRFPEQKLFDNWRQKAVADFTFTVKVPQIITHVQKFKKTENLLNDFYAIAHCGLKEMLGPILFQLPPSMKFNEGLLQEIIGQLNPAFQNVFEFRNMSWWRNEVLEALKNAKIIFSGVSYPGLISNPIADLPVAYYRFHGVPQLYHSKYEEKFLSYIFQQLHIHKPATVYMYFNNTATGAAIENAKFMQALVANTD